MGHIKTSSIFRTLIIKTRWNQLIHFGSLSVGEKLLNLPNLLIKIRRFRDDRAVHVEGDGANAAGLSAVEDHVRME